MAERQGRLQRNPNAPLRILSLDGGGVRGLSSLMVLDQVMQKVALEEKRLGRGTSSSLELKPCDYFDLIGGTSTGGIIAVLLGRLRLSCRECISIYRELSKVIFKEDHSVKVGKVKIPTGSYRFSGQVLENKIKEELRRLGYPEDEKMWDSSLFYEDQEPGRLNSIWADQSGEHLAGANPTPTRLRRESIDSDQEREDDEPPFVRIRDGNIAVDDPEHQKTTQDATSDRRVYRRQGAPGCASLVVTALEKALGLPRILATYDPEDKDTKIWEALRATTAAPTFFEPITFGNPPISYLDGGMGWNNPTKEVAFAAKRLWPHRSIGIIISIGTGLQKVPQVRKGPWLPFGLGTDIALASALASMATSTSRVHNEMQRDYHGTATKYIRFDVEAGLANVSLDEWMREVEISSKTKEYMDHEGPSRLAFRASQLLVQLTHLPKVIAIPAEDFGVGIRGRGLIDGTFKLETIDFKTQGRIRTASLPINRLAQQPPKMIIQGSSPLSSYSNQVAMTTSTSSSTSKPLVTVSKETVKQIVLTSDDDQTEESPGGHSTSSTMSIASPGMMINPDGGAQDIVSYVYPILEDLDGDGRREEAMVLTCVKARKVCLRLLRSNLPPGQYRVTFLVRFTEAPEAATTTTVTTTADYKTTTTTTTTIPANKADAHIVPPTELIFSAGRPYSASTFLTSVPDVRIAADIGPVLLHLDAARVRVGRKRHARLVGKGWQELRADNDVVIGTAGELGVIVTCPFREGMAVSNWSFGGIRIEPLVHEPIPPTLRSPPARPANLTEVQAIRQRAIWSPHYHRRRRSRGNSLKKNVVAEAGGIADPSVTANRSSRMTIILPTVAPSPEHPPSPSTLNDESRE